MFGLDYVTSPGIAALKLAGVGFVCRYLSEVNPATQVKLLSAAEAKTLSEAGISIVSNYEWYGNRAAEGYDSGVADAKIATAQHTQCGGPENRPIYFSVDFNTDATPAIIAYFQGVASVIGLARTGAYGGYTCIKGLFDAGVIRWGWQTYAWSGGVWDSRAQIQQYQNDMVVGGQSVDYDRSTVADFGQWTQGETMIPAGWKDDGTTLTASNGVGVQHGDRDYILNHAWDPADVPLRPEYYVPSVLLHNAAVGAGSRLTCKKSLLWYTKAQGVVQEGYVGWELDAAYQEIATLQSQIATQQAQIAALQAQLNQQPAPTIDTTKLTADAQAAVTALQAVQADIEALGK